MAFEKGLSRNILQQHISVTADELYYATSETERINVRTTIEDLISRVTVLEQSQVAPESVPKYISWTESLRLRFPLVLTTFWNGQNPGAWALTLSMSQAIGLPTT